MDGMASHAVYCAVCRARKCPECNRFGGRHQPSCRYLRRRRRPRTPRKFVGGVTEGDILSLAAACRAEAHRTARAIVGRAEADDIVQDVLVSILQRRDYLRPPLGRAYLLSAVRQHALWTAQRPWAWRRVAVDPAVLTGLENGSLDRYSGRSGRGRHVSALVTLPEDSAT